jgi:hypothetical protein
MPATSRRSKHLTLHPCWNFADFVRITRIPCQTITDYSTTYKSQNYNMQIQDIKINATFTPLNPDSQFFMERLQRRANPSWLSPSHNDIASSNSHGSITPLLLLAASHWQQPPPRVIVLHLAWSPPPPSLLASTTLRRHHQRPPRSPRYNINC